MQKNKLSVVFSQQDIKISPLLLLWILGLLFGAFAGCSCSAAFPWMRRVLSAPVSIVSLFICAFFPFALSAAAFFCGKSWLIYFLSFLKAFAFTYTGSVCLICFGSSGWLVRFFLLFTQIATIPALWYFWLCCCQGRKKVTRYSVSLLSLYIASVALLDYYWIAPFLIELSL